MLRFGRVWPAIADAAHRAAWRSAAARSGFAIEAMRRANDHLRAGTGLPPRVVRHRLPDGPAE